MLEPVRMQEPVRKLELVRMPELVRMLELGNRSCFWQLLQRAVLRASQLGPRRMGLVRTQVHKLLELRIRNVHEASRGDLLGLRTMPLQKNLT